jgi:uncharacterized membrane protein YtjA (UPF0391 family)
MVNKMAEMSNQFRIVLLFNIIVAFIYGFMYLVIPEITRVLRDATFYDPQFWRLWGGTCICLGIMGIIGLMRNVWEEVKILIEFAIIWLIMALIIGLWSFSLMPRTATGIASQWFDNILIIIIIAIDTYAYIQEEK